MLFLFPGISICLPDRHPGLSFHLFIYSKINCYFCKTKKDKNIMDELTLSTPPSSSRSLTDSAGLYQPFPFLRPTGAYPEGTIRKAAFGGYRRTDRQSAQAALSHTQHAGAGNLPACSSASFPCFSFTSAFTTWSVYVLWPCPPATDCFSGSIHLGNTDFRQCTGDSSERHGILIPPPARILCREHFPAVRFSYLQRNPFI